MHGWTGFNIKATSKQPVLSVIGYCPVINASPTQYDVVYTILDTAKKITEQVGQTHTVLVIDQAIYCKAVDIVVDRKNEFAKVVLRMGPFHIMLAFLGVLGKRMECSGFEDILVESDAFAEGSVSGVMSGRSYNRAVRAHKLVAEAIERLLHEKLPYENLDPEYKKTIKSAITNVCQSFIDENRGNSCTAVAELSEQLDPLLHLRESTMKVISSTSQLSAFWLEYHEVLDILLNFIGAE